MVNKLFDGNEDLKIFSDAQTATIISLNKKINELNREIERLKSQNIPSITSSIVTDVDDEETIARTQLNLLKNVALTRELTYEETKKVDIYAKLLISLMGRKKEKGLPGDEAETADLLKIVESSND